MFELALAISKAEVGKEEAASAGAEQASAMGSPEIARRIESQPYAPPGPAASPLRESSSRALGSSRWGDAQCPYSSTARVREYASAPPAPLAVDTSQDEALAWRLHQEERDAAAVQVRTDALLARTSAVIGHSYLGPSARRSC